MTRGTPEPSSMPDTVYVLGHLGVGSWFEPQAMLGRMAVRLCNVTAGVQFGGKSFCLLQVALGFGVRMRQWI